MRKTAEPAGNMNRNYLPPWQEPLKHRANFWVNTAIGGGIGAILMLALFAYLNGFSGVLLLTVIVAYVAGSLISFVLIEGIIKLVSLMRKPRVDPEKSFGQA